LASSASNPRQLAASGCGCSSAAEQPETLRNQRGRDKVQRTCRYTAGHCTSDWLGDPVGYCFWVDRANFLGDATRSNTRREASVAKQQFIRSRRSPACQSTASHTADSAASQQGKQATASVADGILREV
jgi:hypothetical protein